MSAVVEQVVTRAVPRPDGRSWLRWGAAVFVVLETIHLVGGTLGNDWEGWRTFFQNAAFVIVSGVILVGLTYGVLVRWGLKASPGGRNRAALTGLGAGLLSVVAYAAFFAWAPVLIAPSAVLLGRAGLGHAREGRGGHAAAAGATVLGLASLAVFVALLTYAALNDGNYPWIFGG